MSDECSLPVGTQAERLAAEKLLLTDTDNSARPADGEQPPEVDG